MRIDPLKPWRRAWRSADDGGPGWMIFVLGWMVALTGLVIGIVLAVVFFIIDSLS